MKLLGSTKTKIKKDGNGKNVPCLEIADIVLIIAKLLITVINKIQEFCIDLSLINFLTNY